MKQTPNLQDIFLNRARRENIGITVFLIGSDKVKGTVRGFDNYTIILETVSEQQLIYKHSISMIIPSKKIDLSDRK